MNEPTVHGETKRGVNLDELQQETEKLLALLRDRQPGLMTWNMFMFMHERLQSMHLLISTALGEPRAGTNVVVAGKASCGCVYHAEEGIPCEHDRALVASSK